MDIFLPCKFLRDMEQWFDWRFLRVTFYDIGLGFRVAERVRGKARNPAGGPSESV